MSLPGSVSTAHIDPKGAASLRPKAPKQPDKEKNEDTTTTATTWDNENNINHGFTSYSAALLALSLISPLKSLRERRASSPGLDEALEKHKALYVKARSHNLLERAFALVALQASKINLLFKGVSFKEVLAFENEIKDSKRPELQQKWGELAMSYAQVEAFG